MLQNQLKSLGMLFALSILVSCGSAGSGGAGSSPAPTATLTASPASFTAPGTSKLTFASTNATQGTIDNGVGPVGGNGTVEVQPTTTTTYTYTATGPGGNATAQATVTVIPVPVPTATLSASPATITAGQGSSTLTFTSTNATTGSIDNGVGPVGINSHVSVTPALTTTYTYTATGQGGSATAQATVTVTPAGPAPTVTFSASPTAILAGQSSTLTWTSANATSVVIEPAPGAVQLNGSGPVSPPAGTTTYTLTATGDGQQTTATATVTASPINSFDGMAQDATNLGSTDIDPNGAIGTKQFMEYVNTEYQAFDKVTFAPVWSAPQPIGTPWVSPLNTANNQSLPDCDGALVNGLPSGIQLDTVINFDRLASRWVIAAKATFSNVYYFCIAVSNTDDLTSSTLGWYAYVFTLDLGQNGGKPYFPDWPKLGTWTDSYYATMDLEDVSNSYAEVGVAVCAFNRASMLAGATQVQSPLSPSLCVIYQTPLDPTSGTYLAHSLIPADVDGATPPPAGRDEFMVSIENPVVSEGAAGTSSTINLWDFQQVDWTATTPSLVRNALTTPAVTTYIPGCYYFGFSPAQTNCVPEPTAGGIGQHIDSVGDRLMPRFAYRNFLSTSGYESFLVSHTVQTGLNVAQNPLQTGVRWYELRDSGSGTPSIFQEGTINPDNFLFRFLPSIAQDKNGNAAVGYSVSDSLTNPGINFSYWNLATATAPTEVTVIEGAAEEVTSGNGYGQWGSYSSMTVDPVDDCTFWYVNEYWPTDTAWATRIANFQIPGCQ
jgi:hypothetical protein